VLAVQPAAYFGKWAMITGHDFRHQRGPAFADITVELPASLISQARTEPWVGDRAAESGAG